MQNLKSKTTFIATFISALISANALSANYSPIQALKNSCIVTPVKATTYVKLHLNLSSADAIPSVMPFDPSNPASFNYQNNIIIYDSLGVGHKLGFYYIKSKMNEWVVNLYVDETAQNTGTLTFSSNGQLTTATGMSLQFNPGTGATSPQEVQINMLCTTQYGSPDELIEFWQDGNVADQNFHALVPASPLANINTASSCIEEKIKATTQVKLHLNLSAADVLPAMDFDPETAASYNFKTDVTIYDSLGAPYKLSLYYVKNINVNTWKIYAYIYKNYVGKGQVVFDSKGFIRSVNGLDNLYWLPYSGADSPQYFSVDLTCSTQFGKHDQMIEDAWQDGMGG